MTHNGHQGTRAFVLGLDGVPWDLIREWVNDGDLRHFAQLFEEGAAGPLESTIPYTTPLAWPAIATGVAPDKHGVYGFQNLSSDYTHRMYSSRDIRRPELWEILSPALIGNVPLTYPADDLDGKVLTGMFTPELDEQWAHPAAFRKQLLDRVDEYEIGLDWSAYIDREAAFLSDLTDLVDTRRQAMELLMETTDWRLFFFVYTAPDRLQHLVWDPSVLLEHYQHLDDILGDVMAYVQERDATLYVVSDHGFGPISKFVAVNRVLENGGLLTRQENTGARAILDRLGVSRERFLGALSDVGISKQWLQQTVPAKLVHTVASQMPGEHALFDVDFEQTRVFAHGSGMIYVNDTERFEHGCVPPQRISELKAEATQVLTDLQDPDTGDYPLEVHDGDELFAADTGSPDLVVVSGDGYELQKAMSDTVFSDTDGKVASHRSEGIYLAWGPNVRAGATPEDAAVVDVAPTLLHGLGEPVPHDTDGRVLTEIFEPDSAPTRSEIETTQYAVGHGRSSIDRTSNDVEARLRGLGYIE